MKVMGRSTGALGSSAEYRYRLSYRFCLNEASRYRITPHLTSQVLALKLAHPWT